MGGLFKRLKACGFFYIAGILIRLFCVHLRPIKKEV